MCINFILFLSPKMLSMTSELERVNGVINSDLQHLKVDTYKEMTHLEEKIRSSTADIKSTVQAHKDSNDSHRDKVETRLLSTIHKATQSWSEAMVTFYYESDII